MQALKNIQPGYTLEEYAELEKNSEEKLEFFEGNVWSMAGASERHEDIISNTITELKTKLRGRGCKVYGSNLRVKVPIYPPYRYPGVTAVCDERTFENFLGLDVLVNPSLIVEVLSPSTEAFDLNAKFTYYKSIESLTEYMLVAQEFPHVTLYTKQTEEVWLHREYNSLDAKIYLSSLDCEISMSEIYLDIEFDESNRPRFPVDRPEFR